RPGIRRFRVILRLRTGRDDRCVMCGIVVALLSARRAAVVALDVKPLEARMSIRESVERALSALIVSGELAPRTLVSVPTLATQFDVSATPVREAMLELERRGFVEAVKNKGFRVTDVSREELANIVEVRQLLEPPAMEQLAGRFPMERLHEL